VGFEGTNLRENFSDVYLGEIWQPRDNKKREGGEGLATSIMDFEGGKLASNPHIMRKNFLKSSFYTKGWSQKK
jgi:hypothetical protein